MSLVDVIGYGAVKWRPSPRGAWAEPKVTGTETLPALTMWALSSTSTTTAATRPRISTARLRRRVSTSVGPMDDTLAITFSLRPLGASVGASTIPRQVTLGRVAGVGSSAGLAASSGSGGIGGEGSSGGGVEAVV